MIQQRDVDQLLRELEQARELLLHDRASLARSLGPILERAAVLHQHAVGGPFEPAIASVFDLLQSLQAGVHAQEELHRLQDAA